MPYQGKLHVLLDTNIVMTAVEGGFLSSPTLWSDDSTVPSEDLREWNSRLVSACVAVLAIVLFNCRVIPVAGPKLIEEYNRNLKRASSGCEHLRYVLELLNKKVKVIRPASGLVEMCQKVHPKNDPADAEHAAVCLQVKAPLVSLDVHFNAMSRELDRRGISLEVYGPDRFLEVVLSGRHGGSPR